MIAKNQRGFGTHFSDKHILEFVNWKTPDFMDIVLSQKISRLLWAYSIMQATRVVKLKVMF